MAKSASKDTKAPAKAPASKGSKAQKAIEAEAEVATGKTKNDKAKQVPPVKKVNAALSKPLKVSEQLAAVVGKGPMPRTEVVSQVWDYIRKHDLQNPENRREILADDKLKVVFGQDKATMFEMNKLLSAHLTQE
ncbi:SWIB/MDM2 domain-containing protein [Lichenihabitans sp. Uapishka_5]|uniref:SWIB/MDM2 domain-containing protein n=1 Tax=Lichenihabitans sp. Uapishka_5 TaxID=3037302 RepID=UPI0029E7F2DE|nr:SWIB/MDM2 domain-containing protein [Lichenihabitans sp. Uapishka_5]MDX7951169.1 SWIB/MDM2 domain-containing protein [Lichenihabitans sp. Uapishka_5]